MKLLTNNKWFTLVELVVVITILAILSSVWIVSYQDYIRNARNSVRISDMSNIKIWLKNHKLKNWSYPIPWWYLSFYNSWIEIFKQWELNDDVATEEISKKPKDPYVAGKSYMYSTLSNKLIFQIWMINELNDSLLSSYVDWDYQRIADKLPSILIASSQTWEINVLSWWFIIDKSPYNLPYDESWDVYNWWKKFSEITAWLTIPTFAWYTSCDEILQNWKSYWSWYYYINPSWTWVIKQSCSM